jgi:hypothetical protein
MKVCMSPDGRVDNVTLVLALILLGGVVLMASGFDSRNTLLVSTGIPTTLLTSFMIIIRTITNQRTESRDLK